MQGKEQELVPFVLEHVFIGFEVHHQSHGSPWN